MRRIMITFVATVFAAVALAAFSLLGGAQTTLACHEHQLHTPGTTVEDIASGQTSKEIGEGGYHKFHVNVHKGVPGDNLTDHGVPGGAFQSENNPVSVIGDPFAATCD
ncbi:MAG: hypothetical protein WEE64_00415 [Dehalococcoidia bacterium]